ncbi:MAG: phosphoribosylglycinamide formyltransferase [Bacteroidetes bacterium]|nr:phosphoribosylglycinamide formyltransferase [Bacteroidota bacterium]
MAEGTNTRARIAVLASGSGSNAEAILAHFSEGAGAEVGEVVWVATNRREAGVRERARRFGVEESHVPKTDMASGALLEELRARRVGWVVLAGFLLKVPSDVCAAFEGRMVNVHPALLPNYGGAGMYGMNVHRAVKEAGEAVSGMTIHFVNEHYDEGDIVFQGEVDLAPEDSADDIAAKVLTLEHRHYPTVLEGLIRLAQGTDVRDDTHLKSLKP